MQLSYRGARYNHQPSTIETMDSGLEGVYRGQVCHFSYPRHMAQTSASIQALTYRGAGYYTTASGTVVAPQTPAERLVAKPTVKPLAKTKTVPMDLKPGAVNLAKAEYAEVHRLHIQQRLQHRIDVAKSRGDQNLLKVLETEMQQAS